METETNLILLHALDKINSSEFSEAKELLEQILQSDSNNCEIYKNLGLCEINLDDIENAKVHFKKAYELNNQDALSLYYYACCVSKTDKTDAARLFSEVIRLRPEYLDAYKNLSMIYVEEGQLDLSVETALSAVNNSAIELDYSIFYILATSYMLKKDYISALGYLEHALELQPGHLSIMNSLATCYMNIQKYDDALEVLKKAYEIEPNNSLTAYNLGICYQIKEEYKEALKYFQEAYKLEPSIAIMASLAYCALKGKDFVLASNLYQNLVAAYPNNTQYRFSYIEALESLEKYEKALENTDALLSLDEKNVLLIKKKGTYLRKLERNEESNEVFKTLLNRGKIDVEVYYNLAFNFVALEDYDNAKEMFKKCIILEPNNPYAHKDLGVLYLKMNCYDWAVDEMLEAIRIEDDVAEFHYSLGVSYMMLSEIQKAKQSFMKALEYEPDNADTLAYLGYVYILENDLNKAQEILLKALKIQPDNFLAKTHIAKLYFRLQKYETAKELLSDIVEKTQDDEMLNMLAVCYMKLNDYDCAMGILYKLALKYPKNHILLTDLALCEKECGKKKEALEHIRQALMVYEDYEDALKILKELQND